MISARERDAGTPSVGEDATDRGDGGRGDDACREQEPELRIREVKGPFDVDRGDREHAGVEAEADEAGGDRPQRGSHAAVSCVAMPVRLENPHRDRSGSANLAR